MMACEPLKYTEIAKQLNITVTDTLELQATRGI